MAKLCPFAGPDEVDCGDWCELYDPGDRSSCGLTSIQWTILDELRMLRQEIGTLEYRLRELKGIR